MQGQNRNQNGTLIHTSNMSNDRSNGHGSSKIGEYRGTSSSQRSQSFSGGESYEYSMGDDSNLNDLEPNDEMGLSNGSHEVRSTSNSDQITTQSDNDNISTIPLKSITSVSTKSPSVLSANQDNNSYVASTAETSIAPSMHGNSINYQTLNPHNSHLQLQAYDRDSESIVTLASSSRRTRRRSLETNSSTAGIPPASIMERLAIHPNAASSTYAASIHNASNDRTSIYNANMGASQSSATDLNEQANPVN